MISYGKILKKYFVVKGIYFFKRIGTLTVITYTQSTQSVLEVSVNAVRLKKQMGGISTIKEK